MPKVIAASLDSLRESLWFIPALAVATAIIGAEAMVALSRIVEIGWLPLVFQGGPGAARALLQVISGSVITVAGVTFSVTIIALQLTSTQFSPRVLRNFLRDRANQSVLAAFLATFSYSLMVLTSVRSAADDQPAFVPLPALVGAVVLMLLSLGMLVYFIDHIAHEIQVSEITDRVGRETRDTIRRLWRAPSTRDDPEDQEAIPDDEAPLPARQSGYLLYAAHDRLVSLARDADATLRLCVRPGEWVSEGRPLVAVSPAAAAERLRSDPRDEVELGAQPTLQQDIGFGVRQLADIALKALSPSLNDPTTAVTCVHHLTALLLEAGRMQEPRTRHADDHGHVRLITPFPDFGELVALAFDQLRHYGGDRMYVALALAEAFRTLTDDLPPHRHAAVQAQAARLSTAVRDITPESDRRAVMDALAPVLPQAR